MGGGRGGDIQEMGGGRGGDIQEMGGDIQEMGGDIQEMGGGREGELRENKLRWEWKEMEREKIY